MQAQRMQRGAGQHHGSSTAHCLLVCELCQQRAANRLNRSLHTEAYQRIMCTGRTEMACQLDPWPAQHCELYLSALSGNLSARRVRQPVLLSSRRGYGTLSVKPPASALIDDFDIMGLTPAEDVYCQWP
jgi:hypothetical protein